MKNRWQTLQVGDRVRLLCVPAADLRQREREIRENVELPGWTADTLEHILQLDPVVVIEWIDEFGAPWFEYELEGADGNPQYHSIAIVDDDSWEFA